MDQQTIAPELAAALTGGRKPMRLPSDFDHDRALELFTEQPSLEDLFLQIAGTRRDA